MKSSPKKFSGGNSRWKQGFYNVENQYIEDADGNKRLKYVGQEPPRVLSSWEHKVCSYFDNNKSVVEWDSEPDQVMNYFGKPSEGVGLPYHDPVKGKTRNYFPDFYAKMEDKDGNPSKYIIEVKPFKQVVPPKKPKRKTAKSAANYTNALKTHATNWAKWMQTIDYILKFNEQEYKRQKPENMFKFMILTERSVMKDLGVDNVMEAMGKAEAKFIEKDKKVQDVMKKVGKFIF